ncbi:MAG: phosphoribosylformylglycinamidine synthase subunit PurS [Streptosporangiaceae bacterium]
MAKIVVDVMLKPEIHDPQGEAIAGACHRLGFTEVLSVRQGKRFEVELTDVNDQAISDGRPASAQTRPGSGDAEAVAATGSDEMASRVAELAAELLANPIIEEFAIHGA